MTVDPSALQTARLSIGQIRLCWPMLGDARTTRVSRPHVALSGRAAATRDADLRAERADRDSTTTYRALAASPAPVRLEVVDAERNAVEALTALHWTIRSDLRQWQRYLVPWPTGIQQRLTWLTTMLDATSAAAVDQAAEELPRIARTLAAAVGHQLADDWKPTSRRCPSCGQRALSRWDASPDRREHTVECTGETYDEERDRNVPCRCAGDGCPCGRPGARAGSKHLWPTT